MTPVRFLPNSKFPFPNPKTHSNSPPISLFPLTKPKTHSNSPPVSQFPLTKPKTHFSSLAKPTTQQEPTNEIRESTSLPTMSEILASSRTQNLDIKLQTLGPFFRITARSLETQNELGRSEGFVRVWLRGKILHLDSIRLRRETLGMEKSIFGIGLFIGAVAIRYGFDCGCKTAELLAINDSDLYHTKLVRFYKRLGFKTLHEVTGSTIGDMSHMLVWGGIGTRMDADIEDLLIKWCSRFKSRS